MTCVCLKFYVSPLCNMFLASEIKLAMTVCFLDVCWGP